MPFLSQHASLIWDRLYTVLIPDQISHTPEYIKRFGVHVTTDKNINKMLSTNMTMVKIPIITIVENFNSGIEIQIPDRSDMIQMHKHIELYLQEWKEYMRSSIHGNTDAQFNKDLIVSLEKLSKHIYEKAKPSETIENLFLKKDKPLLGLVSPLQAREEMARVEKKPDYEGIKHLIKKPSNKSSGRFG